MTKALSADPSWLDDVVLVNDNVAPEEPGDVQIYRSSGEACRALEDWWVEAGEGMVLSGRGDRLVLGVQGGRVVEVSREPHLRGADLIVKWLQSAAASVRDARIHRSRKAKALLGARELTGQLPQTVEGLIAYVGFSE